ncbi:MAG: hypothetical protein KF760_29105 [Candidatus Eremiobacteraeota bacterium]|nr:hypothetical protein [Candidatus Eremiobacteraeota bacterium]MCW5865968.1 hypothetical protein [Candidatus Eremiobacteraeota bacterium]
MNISAQIPQRNQWLAPGAPTRELTPQNLAQSDYVSLSLESPGAEDALLAAGMALAQGKPTVLSAPERSHLPWFLREADASYPSQVTITQGKQPLQVQARPEPIQTDKKFDTFIGCLMSGLSKEQYAEGHTHLQQINESLGGDNYCEGLAVKSSDSFGTPKESLVVDLEAVKGSDRCVFYQYDNSSRPSGMWVELGAALAWGKECTLLTPDLNGVPPAVREGMPGLKVIQYGSHDQLFEKA